MGLKDAAKALMAKAGVPVTPGYLGEDQSPQRLQHEADAIGYPRPDQGGRGGGGRQGACAASMLPPISPDALASCRREAAAAFGDDRVLIEKYILNPPPYRGAGVRRHPREHRAPVRARLLAPAPPPEGDRGSPRPRHGRGHPAAALCRAAVKAARAVDYVGAGTIEFIADASQGLRADRIWFMEMNTRACRSSIP